MPDQFQYIKLPDGSYGKFAADAGDDVIRSAISKDFPDAFKPQQPTVQKPIPLGLDAPRSAAIMKGNIGPMITPGLTEKAMAPVSPSESGKAVLQAAGAAAPAMFAPASVLGRMLLNAGSAGAVTAGEGGAPKDIARSAGLQTLIGGGLEALPWLAPKIAESALGVTAKMRGYGRTVGQAVMNETSGVRPSTLAQESQQQINNLTSQMEANVNQATASGAKVTTDSAHQVLDKALDKAPRNAVTYRDKLGSLRDLLDFQQGAQGPQQRVFTPTELLEMKRGIGTEINSWEPTLKKTVEPVKRQLYQALDQQLDAVAPGNAELNQRISSLIPAKKRADVLSNAAPFAQKIAGRVAAHTGALAGAGIGAGLGYREKGLPGAMAGGVAGLMLPELLSSPTGQMTAARTAQNARYALPFLPQVVGRLNKLEE
jgi:hypothetical protein